jgi:glyoxylate reductase
MNIFTVVATSELPDIAREILGELDYREHPWKADRAPAELACLLRDADAAITLVGDRIDEALLRSCPSLKVVSNFAVGHDNVDLEAAARRGIWVTNTPGVLTDATADLTLALILATTRRIVEGHAIMMADRFPGLQPLYMLGSGLQGKTLGVIGLGRIGLAVAERAVAFGMNVIFTTRSAETKAQSRFERVSFEELLVRGDIISIHCPLTPETHRLFDAATLASMKARAYLINTSRGAVVDEEALAEALRSGRLAGAGLDVFENEPHAHPALLSLPNVVLVPHVGSATVEARTEMARLAALNVLRVLEGERPLHAVVEPVIGDR